MILLLDTHTFLWFIAGSDRISAKARNLIENEENQSFVSMATVWEMAIKVSIGKLELGEPFKTFIPNQLQMNGFRLLPIDFDHVASVASLEFHHRDPFDRLLAAQSINQQVPIVSADRIFDANNVERLW
jgi:PIN domain nuclease of toxin-antitoxin system